MASRATCGLFPGYLHVFTGFSGGLSAVLSAFHHFKTHLGSWKVPARVHFGLFMVQMPPKWVKMASRGTYGLMWLVLRVLADTSGLLGWFRPRFRVVSTFSDQYRPLEGACQGSFWPFYGPNSSKIGENGFWGHLWTIVGFLRVLAYTWGLLGWFTHDYGWFRSCHDPSSLQITRFRGQFRTKSTNLDYRQSKNRENRKIDVFPWFDT